MIEDIIVWPWAYPFEMLIVWWSFTRPFEINPYNSIPTMALNTLLIVILALFAVRTWQGRKRMAVLRIILLPVVYVLVVGILSLPVELAWHKIVERRFIATQDYVVGFHPFTPPNFLNFMLKNGQWVEQGPSYFYSKPLIFEAKPGAIDLHEGGILAIWAILAIGIHSITFLVCRRLNRRMAEGRQSAPAVYVLPVVGKT